MPELLDDNLLELDQSYSPTPTRLKIVGVLLSLLWMGYLLLGANFYYTVALDFLGIGIRAADLVLMVLLMWVLSRSYQPIALQQYIKKVRQWFLILLVGIVSSYLWDNMLMRYSINYSVHVLAIALLTSIIIKAYQTRLESASIWPWLRKSMWAWCVATWVIGVVIINAMYSVEFMISISPVVRGSIFAALLLFLSLHTLQFYKRQAKPSKKAQEPKFTASFIISCFIVVIGQIIAAASPMLGLLVAAMGVGGGMIVGLAAWIKYSPDPN